MRPASHLGDLVSCVGKIEEKRQPFEDNRDCLAFRQGLGSGT